MAGAWLALLAASPTAAQEVAGQVHPPAGAMRLDGRVDDAEWRGATEFDLAWEVVPGDATEARFETMCRVLVDDSNFWFSCVATDPDPGSIRVTYAPRDRIDAHDRAGIMIDPWGDGQRGYLFLISALGVQADGLLDARAADGLDTSWNTVWESAALIDDSGYSVEGRIPLASLRFPSSASTQRPWGIYFMRGRERSVNAWTYSYPRDRRDPCEVCQAPRYSGFEGLQPGRALDLIPYLSGSSTQIRGTTGGLGSRDTDMEIGGDARWGITSGLSLSATLNPDFSQIEADVAQAQANERFALLFPERRPFFQEGSELFSTPMRTFYSRQIADPEFGAKLTGKIPGGNIGILVARDRVTNVLLPGVEGSSIEQRPGGSTAIVGRASTLLGGNATLGAGGTWRDGDGYSNQTASLDLYFRPVSSLWVDAQAVGSWTREIAAHGGEADSHGLALNLRARLGLEHWEAWFESERISSGFRADLGFLPQVGIWQNQSWVRILDRATDAWFTRLDATAGVMHLQQESGTLIERQFFGRLHYEGPMTTRLTLNPRVITQQWAGSRYDFNQLWVFTNWRPLSAVRLDLVANRGGVVDVAGQREARRWQFNSIAAFRIGAHLNLEARANHQTLSLPQGGRILREGLYQLRGELSLDARTSLRMVLQRRDTKRGPGTPRVSDTLFSQLIFAWQPNALTALYLGWAEDRAALAIPDSGSLSRSLEPVTRRFFMKFSRLLRP